MQGSKRLTEGALLTALYIGLLLVTFFIPFVELFTLFILPVPFIVYASRYGIKPGSLVLIAAVVISAMFATVFSIPMTLLMGAGGLAIGHGIYNQKNPYEIWARGTVGYVIGFLFIYLITQWLFQVDWAKEMDNILQSSLSLTKDLMGPMGTDGQFELIQQQLDQIPYLIPSGLALTSIILAFVSQWFGYKVINRFEKKKLAFPRFDELNLPTAIIWYYLFSIIAMWIVPEQGSIWNQAAVNVYTLTGILVTLQGLSFIFYFARTKKLSKAVPIGAIVAILLLPLLLLNLVRILGIIDLGFRLRERLKPKE